MSKYVTWSSIGTNMSKEEFKRVEELQARIDREDKIIIDILVDHFDDLFRKEGSKNGKPVYIYDYASDWSDNPHLEISMDDWYKSVDEPYWDVFRRGANSGEIFENPQEAFRWYLGGGTYDLYDLDKDGIGFPDEIEELIKKGLGNG
jgi:hypothetical protein